MYMSAIRSSTLSTSCLSSSGAPAPPGLVRVQPPIPNTRAPPRRAPRRAAPRRPAPPPLLAARSNPSSLSIPTPACARATRSVAFPLDLVALAALVLFLFWASLFAIGSIGVRIACVLLYRVSPAATSPQALLLVAVLMQLVGFMLCLQLPALLPQYATFGAQTVAAAGGTRQPCALHSPAAIDGRCHSTYMVRMTHHVYSGIPALAVLFQFVNWAFVAACALWLARFVCTRARSRRRRQRDQLDEEEVQGLLDS